MQGSNNRLPCKFNWNRFLIAVSFAIALCSYILYFSHLNSKSFELNVSWELNLPEATIVTESIVSPPKCIHRLPRAASAYRRAKSNKCQNLIEETSCRLLNGSLDNTKLQSNCSLQRQAYGVSLGCFRDNQLPFLHANFSFSLENRLDDWTFCSHTCLNYAFSLFAIENGTICFCLDQIDSSLQIDSKFCAFECKSKDKHCGGYLTASVYKTGVNENRHVLQSSRFERKTSLKIAFILFWSGRNILQIERLFNSIYRTKHVYFVHVDLQNNFLFQKVNQLFSNNSNVFITKSRYETIWGGSQLLTAFLFALKQMILLDGDWDYAINLSESDFPIQSLEKLENYLAYHYPANFVRYHGLRNSKKFVTKQGLNKVFVQCDRRMWLLGERQLIQGIQYNGGSDWVGLTRDFVHFLVQKDNSFVQNLIEYFKFNLLPVESFVHTVLENSPFCDRIINNNLKLTNWKRNVMQKDCEHKTVVDWCGSSPNIFQNSSEDIKRLKSAIEQNRFFARKFDSLIDEKIIKTIEIDFLKQNKTAAIANNYLNVYSISDHETSFSNIDIFGKASIFKLLTILIKSQLKFIQLTDWFKQSYVQNAYQIFQLEESKSKILLQIVNRKENNLEIRLILMPKIFQPKLHSSDLPILVKEFQISDKHDLKHFMLSKEVRFLHSKSPVRFAMRLQKTRACQSNETYVIKFNWAILNQSVHQTSNVLACDELGQDIKMIQLIKSNRSESFWLTPGLWRLQVTLHSISSINFNKQTLVDHQFLIFPFVKSIWKSTSSVDHRSSNRFIKQLKSVSICESFDSIDCEQQLDYWLRLIDTFWTVSQVCIGVECRHWTRLP